MHRTLLRLLLIVSLWVPAAWPKEREVPPPLFMAPDFQFGQVDTICVAPAIDVRTDKTQPLNLSGSSQSADEWLARAFKEIGYQTLSCSPVNATLADLKTPTDTWLGRLNFGESRWLFLLAVEDVSTEYPMFGLGPQGGYAVLSGYLFNKPTAGVRLVWRDTVVARPDFMRTGGHLAGGKKTERRIIGEYAIGAGISRLLASFETRHKRIGVWDNVHEEIFDVTCNVLWSALNDTLKNSGKYEIILVEDSDMMAVYAVRGIGKKEVRPIDYVVLKSKENSCALELVETLHSGFGSDIGGLNKRVRESLSRNTGGRL